MNVSIVGSACFKCLKEVCPFRETAHFDIPSMKRAIKEGVSMLATD